MAEEYSYQPLTGDSDMELSDLSVREWDSATEQEQEEILWHVDDKMLIKQEQADLLYRIAAPFVSDGEAFDDSSVSGYCICQNRNDKWKRYFCELDGSTFTLKRLKKATGEASKIKTKLKVRFVSLAPLSLREKERIGDSSLSTDCVKRFRIFCPDQTRVMVPCSETEFEMWESAFQNMLQERLEPHEFDQRRVAAEEIEPSYQRHVDYTLKKQQVLDRALAKIGFMENQKKNAMRQGVLRLKSESGEWKKTFVLVKKFAAIYHESGKSYKKGFINLKLARVEPNPKSARKFKVVTPMATYQFKSRHDIDAQDWLAALTASSRGEKTYRSDDVLDELDTINVAPYGKPFLVVEGRKYKIDKMTEVIIGRSSACTVTIAKDKKVSREHIKLENRGPSKWVLLDMGSHAGTQLNGTRVHRQLLKPGDKILIGNTVIVFKATKW